MNAIPFALMLFTEAELIRTTSDDWTTREAATVSLAQLMPFSKPRLECAARMHVDPETRARAAFVLDEWRSYRRLECLKAAMNMRPKNWPFVPYIDSLPHDWPERQDVIQRYLGEAGWEESELWTTPDGLTDMYTRYRVATVLFIADELTAGRDGRRVLDAMMGREVEQLQMLRMDEWLRRGAERVPEPVRVP